jgi:membrane-bound lytic murein transglycosylase D
MKRTSRVLSAKISVTIPLTILALLVLAGPEPAAAEVIFPEPAALEPDIHFWERIYSEVGTDAGLLHDTRDLRVVYEVVDLPDGTTRRGRERISDKRRKHYKAILSKLSSGKRSGLTGEEARVLALFPQDVSNRTLRDARSRIRFQLGQATKFRAGVIRSGAYSGHIRAILHELGLPEDIAHLPHVESSFTPHAYSHVGAAGLWQFTRSTGRRYMRVDHVVDERLDPYRASQSAARLLEQNRRVTGSWPLAITAYNHGASGMRRAVRKLGTRDITTILRKYRSRTFGFASRNFYVEFRAASRVASNHEKYFGPLVLDPPIQYESLEMPYYTTATALSQALGIDMGALKRANPALRSVVWKGAKHVPKGFEIKVPRAQLARPMSLALAEIPAAKRHAKQTRDNYHVVRRGESLSVIARRYGVTISELQSLNGLRSRHRIRAGQKLRLPPDQGGTRTAAIRREPVTRTAPPPDGLYTVRRGDTVGRIATRFGMNESDLMAANNLRNRNRIYVGQVLRVSTAVDKAIVAGPAGSEPAAQKNDSHPQALALMTPSRSSELEPTPLAPEPKPALGAEIDVALGDEMADAEGMPQEVVTADTPAEARPSHTPEQLLADPSDYSVAPDGTIEVQPNETLGHYAEWLGIRASRLRSINDISYGEHVVVHAHLQLDFSRVAPEQFEAHRLEYHRGIQEEFFSLWEIDGTESHRIRRGDSIWVLSHQRFKVPMWLLQQYNPDVDFALLSAGTNITVPVLKKRVWEETGAATTAVSAGPRAS